MTAVERAGGEPTVSRPSTAGPSIARSSNAGSSIALTVLAVLAVAASLRWGRDFLIPLTAGLMLALLVTPLVALLTSVVRIRLIAVTLTLAVVMTVIGLAGAAFGDQLARVAGRVPDLISLVAQRVTDSGPGSTNTLLRRARDALRELDRAAERLGGTLPPVETQRPPLARVTPRQAAAAASAASAAAATSAASAESPVSLAQSATVALRDTAVSGSGVLLKLAADLTIVLFVAFFVLAGGAPLANRFLDLWDARPGLRARAEHAARECTRQIHLYGAVLLVTNVVVGIAVWAVFTLNGLPDAGGWGIAAAVLHVVPYLGVALLTGLTAAEAFLAHGTVAAAVGMAAFVVALSTLIGTVVTAWLQGRAAKMNASAVFIGVVFWGSIWGVWGLLLGPALVVLTKVVAEHTRSGRRFARLMQG